MSTCTEQAIAEALAIYDRLLQGAGAIAHEVALQRRDWLARDARSHVINGGIPDDLEDHARRTAAGALAEIAEVITTFAAGWS